MPNLKAFAGVARAPFLLLPVTLIAAGAAAAFYGGAFSWWSTLLALIGLVALHMAVNIFNEWSDMRTGIDLATERTPFSGGSGTLPAGGMSLRAALLFGIACSAVGLAVGLYFVGRVGPVLLPIMVAGAICVLIYTEVLARLGIGEVAAGLGLGGLPVVGAALVNSGEIGAAAVAAGVPASFMTFNLLLLNEFPDEAADRAGGRKNLVLLFGRRPAAWIWAAAAAATPLSIVVAVAMSVLPPLALAACLPSLLLAAPMRWVVSDPMQPVPIPAMGANVTWNLATNTVLAIALVGAALL
ncbi:MAG: 1,4-dihydroxy-2-naphthoate prenyltransferase [Holophagae bacterium]|nr:MAG: 1,4-dihydroxy-2-naphthoate prenyltransferase [Holophagae bacterium]